jgi:NAD(P)-dependent dehydrogenase (short-subunit alcohol dehydrogenase family)
MQLSGQVALITGAGSGIGRATALLFAREGAQVGALGRTLDDVQQTVDDITRAGGDATALVADVSDFQSMQQAVETLVGRYGRLDIAFANAGINGVWASLDDLTPDDWDETLGINLKGTFLTVKAALPHLKVRGGSVLVTSSVNGTRMFSNTGATAYACSKAGQVAFVKMTAIELAQHRIRINVLCPGAIETNIDSSTERKNLEEIRVPVAFPEGEIPLTSGRPGTSEQVAELALFLASDRAAHISGTEVWIDGAQSLLQG